MSKSKAATPKASVPEPESADMVARLRECKRVLVGLTLAADERHTDWPEWITRAKAWLAADPELPAE